MKNLLRIFSLILLLCAFGFACTKDEETNTGDPVVDPETPVVTPEPTPEPTPEIKYEVTFDVDGSLETVEVLDGDKVSKPENPFKDGYIFLGWFIGEVKYDFNSPVTGNVTLVAKFEEVKVPTDEPTVDPVKINYVVMISDIAGRPLSEFYVYFMLDGETLDEGYTGSAGTFTTELEPNYYDVLIEGREGYYLNQELYTTDLIGSAIDIVCELDDFSGVEADASSKKYQLGDLMYDFTVIDTEGNELSLYKLLENKKAILLNFWYTTCSACYYEFPYMVDAYESTYTNDNGVEVKYSDEIAIIAINPGIAGNQDTLDDIKNFKESMGLSFNVAMDYDYDTTNLTMDPALTTMFGITGYPTTVVIDRFGLIAKIEVGSITALDKWTQTFDNYIGDDYYPVYTGGTEQEVIKPNISQPESSLIEEAVNGTNYDGSKFTATYYPEYNDDKDFSWPWIVTEYKGVQCIKPSNKDINPSFAIMYFTVSLKAGEVFAFDYYASTEEYDSLYITAKEKTAASATIATQISNQSSDWEKCFAFIAVKDAEYEIGFCYLKDDSYSMGEDAVFLTNFRITTTDQIDKETYIFREAATGQMNQFTMSYSDYVTVVYNEEDGYYHVGDENGPLLLADMLSGTQWNNSTLYEVCLEGKCIGYDGVDYNALIEEYTVYASNSEVGYTPVTKELANALKQIVKELGHEAAISNENQWLEVCVYYSAYGTDGVELGLPIIGVAPFEPIMFDGDAIAEPAKAEATFDRIILPRGFIFGFKPTKSGVYKFYSTEETLETLGWICDENGVVVGESETCLRLFAEQSTKGEAVDQNFVAYIYLEEGNTYLFRAAFYDVYEYSTITVEMSYVNEKVELLTVASPGFFTSSDDEMSDIIAGNYIDVELKDDGYYHVAGSKASDDFVYCDIIYINNITGVSLQKCLELNAFDFAKDEFGNDVFDEEGYQRYTGYDEENNLIRFYVCMNADGELFYTKSIGEGEYTEENGYTYLTFTEEELESLKQANSSEYVKEYIEENMITDENSELYGCVKVDERFAYVLSMLMDKYTFSGVEGSWLKLCYYYKYIGANA